MKELLQQLLALENFDVILVLGILIGFGLMESLGGFLRNSKRKKGDWFQEIFSFLFLSAGIKPTIVTIVFLLGNTFYPASANLLTGLSFVSVFLGTSL